MRRAHEKRERGRFHSLSWQDRQTVVVAAAVDVVVAVVVAL